MRKIPRHWRKLAVVLFAWAGVAACVSRGRAIDPPGRRDLITREELDRSIHSDLDAYQAIQSLRPQLLAPPPGVQRASAARTVAVYVDGVRQPIGIDALRSIRASGVDEIRYLEPTAASNQLGPLASGGALMLRLRATRRDTTAPDPAWLSS